MTRLPIIAFAASLGMLISSVASATSAEITIAHGEIQTNSQKNSSYGYHPATIPCVIDAAVKQGVPANVLLALASSEMGANGAKLKNTNKSTDFGHFGINSVHFKPGEPLADAGVRPEDVALLGCYNAEVAAWLLARHLRARRGADFWVWAANYHSTTPEKNAIYRKKLVPYAKQWGQWLQYRYPTVSIYQH